MRAIARVYNRRMTHTRRGQGHWSECGLVCGGPWGDPPECEKCADALGREAKRIETINRLLDEGQLRAYAEYLG